MEMLITLILLGILAIASIWFGFTSLKKYKNQKNDDYNKESFPLISVSSMVVIPAIFLALLAYSTMQSVAFGTGAVPVSFGKLRYEVKAPGLQFKYPWEKLIPLSTQQQSFSRNGSIQAKDTVSVTDNVTFHFILNLKQIPFVLDNYGKNYAQKLIFPSATEALKKAAMDFESWDDLLAKRTLFSEKVTMYFKEKVEKKLEKKGLDKKQAEAAFTFPLVDIKELMPPKQLQTNINLKKAAEQELERKNTQIEIAKKEAIVRSYDGTAVRQAILKLLYGVDEKTGVAKSDDLSNVTPEQMAQIIQAMANNRRSETLQTLVEQGGVNSLMVVPSGTPVTATAPSK
jgi:regulator of protease activity HflC (stomatin/prohibitin superfamily)